MTESNAQFFLFGEIDESEIENIPSTLSFSSIIARSIPFKISRKISTNSHDALQVHGNCSTQTIIANEFKTRCDINLKCNIVKINNALGRILKLNGYSYYFVKDRNKLHYGYIAQDVKKVLPNIVGYDNQNFLTLSTIQLIPYITESIKEIYTILIIFIIFQSMINIYVLIFLFSFV